MLWLGRRGVWIEQEHLDRCTALMLGCAAGQRPVSAEILTWYNVVQ